MPVFARVCPITEFHYGEPLSVPSRAQERFLVVRAARGPYMRVAASTTPVVATSDIDRCVLRVQGPVLAVRAMLGPVRVFTDSCSFRIFKNDGLIAEQFQPYLVLNRGLAGLLHVRLQPRNEFGAPLGSEVESNSIYVREGDADEASRRLQSASAQLASAARGNNP